MWEWGRVEGEVGVRSLPVNKASIVTRQPGCKQPFAPMNLGVGRGLGCIFPPSGSNYRVPCCRPTVGFTFQKGHCSMRRFISILALLGLVAIGSGRRVAGRGAAGQDSGAVDYGRRRSGASMAGDHRIRSQDFGGDRQVRSESRGRPADPRIAAGAEGLRRHRFQHLCPQPAGPAPAGQTESLGLRPGRQGFLHRAPGQRLVRQVGRLRQTMRPPLGDGQVGPWPAQRVPGQDCGQGTPHQQGPGGLQHRRRALCQARRHRAHPRAGRGRFPVEQKDRAAVVSGWSTARAEWSTARWATTPRPWRLPPSRRSLPAASSGPPPARSPTETATMSQPPPPCRWTT